MIRSIVLYPNPVLRTRCKAVAEVTDEIRTLVKDMIETMIDADGVGLAAPQVGVPIQLAIVDLSEAAEPCSYLRIDGEPCDPENIMPLVFVNPTLHPVPPRISDTEGCLSFPDIRAPIARPGQLDATLGTLEGHTLRIECDGLLARVIQHETDHLNGVLFIDRMDAANKSSLRGQLRRMKAAAESS